MIVWLHRILWRGGSGIKLPVLAAREEHWPTSDHHHLDEQCRRVLQLPLYENPSNLSRDWRVWAKKNGIDSRVRLHDLRGSFISLLIENGADIRTVQELARHSDPRTTMKVYARARQTVKSEAVAKLETLI